MIKTLRRITLSSFLLVAGAISALFIAESAYAQDTAEELLAQRLKRIRIGLGELVVPGNDPQQLADFFKRMNDLNTELQTEYRIAYQRVTAARKEAAERVIEKEDLLEDELFYQAAQIALPTRIVAATAATEQQRKETLALTTRYLEIAASKGATRDVSTCTSLAIRLERGGATELAYVAAIRFAEIIREADEPKLARYLSSMEDTATRLAVLLGPFELEGESIDGGQLDWNEYRGKVVIVVFWSLEKSPKHASFEKLQSLYKTFHDRGLEIVGVCLDRDREAVSDHLKTLNIPWQNMFEDGTGMQHPMAVKYGVRRLPAEWLIDREGSVVSQQINGFEFQKVFAKLVGPLTFDARVDVLAGRYLEAAKKMDVWTKRNPKASQHWTGKAVALIAGNDLDGYRASVRRQLEVMMGTKYSWARTLRDAGLVSPPAIDANELLGHAREIYGQSKNTHMRVALSLALLRAGKLEECRNTARGEGDPAQIALMHLIRSIAEHKLGKHDDAVASFATGDQIFTEEFSDLAASKRRGHMEDHWITCLLVRQIRDEAAGLIETPDR